MGHDQGYGPWVNAKARPRAWDMGQGHGPLAMGHSPWSWVSVKGRGPLGVTHVLGAIGFGP